MMSATARPPWSAPRQELVPTTSVRNVAAYGSWRCESDGFTLSDASVRAEKGARGELCLGPQARFQFYLEAIGGLGVCGGKQRQPARGAEHRRAVSRIPKDCESWLHAEDGGSFRVVVLGFDEAALERKLGDSVRPQVLREPRYNVVHPLASTLVERLADHVRAPSEPAALYADSLLTLLLVEMVRDETRTSAARSGGLTPACRARVLAYLDAHLDAQVRLADLAALSHLSVSHFCQAFRRSTGRTPHRWLLERRVDVAQLRLLETEEPIATIARALGFADQSHFTRVFRRAVGCTPASWRREKLRRP